MIIQGRTVTMVKCPKLDDAEVVFEDVCLKCRFYESYTVFAKVECLYDSDKL